MSEGPSPALLVVMVVSLFLLIFPSFWMAVCFLIGQLSGWRALATSYREQAPFEGQRWQYQSGYMRLGARYRGTLTAGASPAGLHLSVMVLFRVGHPPLFVRWHEITVSDAALLFGRGKRFAFRAAPSVSLTISADLADKLKAEAGSAWPAEHTERT